jgi:hypothetical protein
MRRLLAVTLAVSTAALAPACDRRPAGPAPSPTVVSTPPATATPESTVDPACAQATAVITDATARFNTRIQQAVTAAERGDVAARDAAVNLVRAEFAGWSARLRAVAARAASPEVRAVLLEYAGAVDAVIARVNGPADLDLLSSFDNQEIDAAASHLAAVCR